MNVPAVFCVVHGAGYNLNSRMDSYLKIMMISVTCILAAAAEKNHSLVFISVKLLPIPT